MSSYLCSEKYPESIRFTGLLCAKYTQGMKIQEVECNL
jgi:hypothetical protein